MQHFNLIGNLCGYVEFKIVPKDMMLRSKQGRKYCFLHLASCGLIVNDIISQLAMRAGVTKQNIHSSVTIQEDIIHRLMPNDAKTSAIYLSGLLLVNGPQFESHWVRKLRPTTIKVTFFTYYFSGFGFEQGIDLPIMLILKCILQADL